MSIPTEPARRVDAGPTDASDRPRSVRRDEVVEEIHGHRVSDPYRWLEAPADDPEIAAFVAAQNAWSESHLATLPHRDDFRDRLRALWSHPRRGAPWRRGAWWFQVRNDGQQDQDVLWRAPAPGDDPRDLPADEHWQVLLDPNDWSEDGTASLTGLAITDDGRRVAFARSDAGSDWMTWRVVEVERTEVLADEIPWSKFFGATWLPDDSGFVYARYPQPDAGQEHAAATRDQQLRLHVVGTDPGDDPLVHARPDRPEWGFDPRVSHDGRWLLVTVTRGTDPETRVHVAAIGGEAGTNRPGGIGPLRPVLDDADARYDIAGVVGDELLVVTDLDAPLGRVLAVDLHDPTRRREVVAETPDRLQGATLVGAPSLGEPGWLVCHRLHHATARLQVHDPSTGAHLDDLALPGPGTVGSVAGGRDDRAVHLTFETFAAPAEILRHDLDAGVTTPVWSPGSRDATKHGAHAIRAEAPDRRPSEVGVVVEQVLVHHDDVAVPLFLVHRADVVPDGEVATVLWGYGGFDIAVTPMHRPAWRAWVDAGGLLAVACLRGGGEYGRVWHDDGRLAVKQHVFDDALACAAWLTGRRREEVAASAHTPGTDVDAVWSSPRHLGIEGGSNGGLLVGACLTQQPDAFGSAVPQVGVLDMVRFHRFTIGWAWTSDYGSPDDPDDLATLLAYSPYHRLVPGGIYPPTLITTGDTDDRVVPAHSYKFAAALQHAQGGDAPVLLRVDTSAGHGAGKPIGKIVEERADVLAFHARHLGLRDPGTP